MQVANSKQIRKVIRAFFKQEKFIPMSTWSDPSRAMKPNNMLNVAWFVGYIPNAVEFLRKAQAAVKAAGYTNKVKITQESYVRVRAPKA